MAFFDDILLRIAKAVLNQVLQQLMQVFNQVMEQVMQPMRQIIAKVGQNAVGGIWRGDGADKFVEEVSQIMIPGVGKVGEHIQTYHRNLVHAEQVMDQADRSVQQQANKLVDVFGGIAAGL